MKILYLTVRDRRPNRSIPTGKINGWKSILNTLGTTYGDRLNLNCRGTHTKPEASPVTGRSAGGLRRVPSSVGHRLVARPSNLGSGALSSGAAGRGQVR